MVEAVSVEFDGTSDIPSPTLSFIRSMGDTGGKWALRGEYSIWAGKPKSVKAPFLLHEWRNKKVLPIRRATARPVMHRIIGGTPFQVAHLFGFWITVDVDTVWIDAGDDTHQYCALIVGGTKGKPGKAGCAWVCPKCGDVFNDASFTIPHQHFERFLDFAQERVHAFNVEPKFRKCPACGSLHPVTYGFYTQRDTDEERKAREAA